MTDVWFIFNNQGQLSFITEKQELANTDLLPPEFLPGRIVQNPPGYDPTIDQDISYNIETNSVVFSNTSLLPPVADVLDLGSLAEIVNGLDLALERLGDRITNVENELGNRITGVENELGNRITSVENTANLNSSTILTMSDTINLILNRLDNLEQNSSSNNNLLLARVVSLEQNAATNNNKISNIEQNVNEIENTLDSTLIV
tara:strand:- start:701 stop:1309 length:609 start_codon:yes stop_codon:yes gene_type:complete